MGQKARDYQSYAASSTFSVTTEIGILYYDYNWHLAVKLSSYLYVKWFGIGTVMIYYAVERHILVEIGLQYACFWIQDEMDENDIAILN